MPSEPGSINDPIRRLMEWQDHRYDPGYFLGGRIHPILLAPRPNKFGYLLIISGSVYSCFLSLGRWIWRQCLRIWMPQSDYPSFSLYGDGERCK